MVLPAAAGWEEVAVAVAVDAIASFLRRAGQALVH